MRNNGFSRNDKLIETEVQNRNTERKRTVVALFYVLWVENKCYVLGFCIPHGINESIKIAFNVKIPKIKSTIRSIDKCCCSLCACSQIKIWILNRIVIFYILARKRVVLVLRHSNNKKSHSRKTMSTIPTVTLFRHAMQTETVWKRRVNESDIIPPVYAQNTFTQSICMSHT